MHEVKGYGLGAADRNLNQKQVSKTEEMVRELEALTNMVDMVSSNLRGAINNIVGFSPEEKGKTAGVRQVPTDLVTAIYQLRAEIEGLRRQAERLY